MLLREGQVVLRPLERADIHRMAAWFNNPDIRRNLSRLWSMSLAEMEHWFDEQSADKWPRIYAIETTHGQHIGRIGIHNVDWRNRTAGLGIVVGEPACWDKGYGTDAVRALLCHIFDQMGLNRVSLTVLADNQRAIRCYEKCGFVREGRLRQAGYRDGQYLDELVMAVLREDYLVSQDNGAVQ